MNNLPLWNSLTGTYSAVFDFFSCWHVCSGQAFFPLNVVGFFFTNFMQMTPTHLQAQMTTTFLGVLVQASIVLALMGWGLGSESNSKNEIFIQRGTSQPENISPDLKIVYAIKFMENNLCRVNRSIQMLLIEQKLVKGLTYSQQLYCLVISCKIAKLCGVPRFWWHPAALLSAVELWVMYIGCSQ